MTSSTDVWGLNTWLYLTLTELRPRILTLLPVCGGNAVFSCCRSFNRVALTSFLILQHPFLNAASRFDEATPVCAVLSPPCLAVVSLPLVNTRTALISNNASSGLLCASVLPPPCPEEQMFLTSLFPVTKRGLCPVHLR